MEVKQGKRFTFTNFNVDEDYSNWKFEYIIYGQETCPTTNKKHHQGYVIFKSNQRLTALKKLGHDIHWENAKGSIDDNVKYCSKEGCVTEIGKRPVNQQGKRTDIDTVKDMVNEGKKLDEIYDVCTSYQALKFAEKGIEIKQSKLSLRDKPYIKWLYGPTGTGKSKLAWEEAGIDNTWCSNGGKFFNGYNGETNVIFDDLRNDDYKFNYLLKLLDKYPMIVEVKGSFRNWKPKNIWITSPMHPEEFGTLTNENVNQLLRRIDEIIYLGNENGK